MPDVTPERRPRPRGLAAAVPGTRRRPQASRSPAARSGPGRRRVAADTGGGGDGRSATSSSPARRTGRSTTTTARTAGAGRRLRAAGLHAARRRRGTHAPFALTSLRTARSAPPLDRRAPAVQRRRDGMLLPHRAARTATGTRRCCTTRRASCRSTTASSATRALRELLQLVLGPTLPNRFYLMSGTSGGITTNGKWGYGIFDSNGWPIILDLLDAAGVTWKIYYIGFDDVTKETATTSRSSGSRWAHDPRTTGRKDDYLRTSRRAGCRRSRGSSRAPPWLRRASVGRRLGRMGFQEEVITALRRRPGSTRRSCSPTTSTAASSTMSCRRSSTRTVSGAGAAVGDLAVRAPRRDHVGQARRARLDAQVHRTAFGLPTLASQNHSSTSRRRPATITRRGERRHRRAMSNNG